MNNKKGTFITFEGPEAVGKSTQIKLIKKFLIKQKIPYLITREPGGTKFSEKLRYLILSKKHNINSSEEILLLMAARLNHINHVIIPALKKGKLVISDRFADSTFVYQGYVNNFGLKKAINLHKIFLNNFLPKKTFLFYLSTNDIISRLKKRKKTNKFDVINKKFHQKVIRGYQLLSKGNNRFVKIDADSHYEIIQKILQKKIINIIK